MAVAEAVAEAEAVVAAAAAAVAGVKKKEGFEQTPGGECFNQQPFWLSPYGD